MTVSDKATNDIFCNAVEALKDPLPQRVWSVIVSLFGDIAQGEGDQISGVALTEVGRLMGIRSEAIRVALHRLRKDGWIESLRDGRSSMHKLTAAGRRASISATPKIYAREPMTIPGWYIICTDRDLHGDTGKTLSSAGIPLSRNSFLVAENKLPDTANMLVFRASPEHVPDWARSEICPDELQQAAVTLETSLQKASSYIAAPPGFDALQTTALRTLIVHRWRRIALRIPDAPVCFFPNTWRGEACQQLSSGLLDQLPAPNLHDLETAASGYRHRDLSV